MATHTYTHKHKAFTYLSAAMDAFTKRCKACTSCTKRCRFLGPVEGDVKSMTATVAIASVSALIFCSMMVWMARRSFSWVATRSCSWRDRDSMGDRGWSSGQAAPGAWS
jgi:hypothetical protein